MRIFGEKKKREGAEHGNIYLFMLPPPSSLLLMTASFSRAVNKSFSFDSIKGAF